MINAILHKAIGRLRLGQTIPACRIVVMRRQTVAAPSVRQFSGSSFLTSSPRPAQHRSRYSKLSNALDAYQHARQAYQSHLQANSTLTPAQWSALCSPLLAKPSAVQIDTWNLVQSAACDPANASPLVLSTLNALLPLYTRSARKGDHAVVDQIVRYCQAHFANHPRTKAMTDMDPLFFKVMVASEHDMGRVLAKAIKAAGKWIQVHEPKPEPGLVSFYLSLVSKHASKASVEQLVSVFKVGNVDSPAVASALISLYSRTHSPDLGVQVWDTCVASEPLVMSAAMAASYCDLLGFHWRKLADCEARLTSVHLLLASGSRPFSLPLAGNANIWTSLLEAAIRANLPHLVEPILSDMQHRVQGKVGIRKAVLTVGTMMKQKQGGERWDKEVQDEIGRRASECLQKSKSSRSRPPVGDPWHENVRAAGAGNGQWREADKKERKPSA